MHIVDRLTAGLTPALDDQQRQLLRVAALLHDIGHLPLSHTLEKALAKIRRSEEEAKAVEFTTEVLGRTREPETHPIQVSTKLHESIGQTIISHGQVASMLEHHGINPLTVTAIAMGQTAEAEKNVPQLTLKVMAQMLHSQMDADRIDYLLRDLSFAGIEAGGFDLPKLYKEVYWSEGRFGFRVSGLRAVEQFLMARLTDYRTVVLNKHVQSFGLMAEEVYYSMIQAGVVPGPERIEEMARANGMDWLRFTDHLLFDSLYAFSLREDLRPTIRKKVQQIINGRPMIQVASDERLCTEKEWNEFIARSKIPLSEEAKGELARRAGVDPEDLAMVESRIKLIEESDDDQVSIWTGAAFENILNLPESYVKELKGKLFFLKRLFCVDDEAADRVRAELHL
jgi:HD superfamily phosphohydrolase